MKIIHLAEYNRKSVFRHTIVRIMKLTVAILVFGLTHVFAVTHAQITLSKENTPLQSVLKMISIQSGYDFIYSDQIFSNVKPVTIELRNASLETALTLCFKGQPLTYKIEDKTVMVRRRAVNNASQKTVDDSHEVPKSVIHVHVADSTGEPLEGATVSILGSQIAGQTDQNGDVFLNAPKGSVLEVSYVGYISRKIKVEDQSEISILLKSKPTQLQEIAVISNGYQAISKERSTGAYTVIDNKIFNRSVSTDVLTRLDGVTSGLIFNKLANKTNQLSTEKGGDPAISIRGRSTLFANTEPLIVLDNFPYDGDPDNINPNDVESITVLKDAAAASIWGVRAGNGVIVITTKRGKLNQPPRISFNSNITIKQKPDVYKVPQMSSKEFIELEKFRFDHGDYDYALNYASYNFQSPVVDILEKQKNGDMTRKEAQRQLDALGKIDVRDDYSKYFLRNQINQQYSVNIGGGSSVNQYYVSASLDQNILSDVASSYNRINITAANTYHFFNDRLSLGLNILFTKSKDKSKYNQYLPAYYPYEQLVDANGKALPVIRDFRQAAKDAQSGLGLPDWNYYPYDERKIGNNVVDLTDYRIGARLDYKVIQDVLDVELNYQYQEGSTNQTINQGMNTYYTRLTIDKYAQVDPTGILSYPIPLGAIVDFRDSKYQSNSGRLQLNYLQRLGDKHEVSAIAGTEIKDYSSFDKEREVFGYDDQTASSIAVDYMSIFYPLIGPWGQRIPNYNGQSGTVDRFLSYYANIGYTYNNKYTFNGSVRRDESNLFGVDANQKGVPLYSLGIGWAVDKESFYRISALPFLKLRITGGYNGNLSKSLSAYTTARTDGINPDYVAPQQVIVNPPNPSLSWERVLVLNAGLDFAFKDKFLTGSIDLYSKKGLDLIGNSPLAPQSGVIQFTGNTSNLLTKGIDLVLNSNNIEGEFGWTTNFLMNYVKDRVTKYNMETGVINRYIGGNYNNPLVGRPYSSVFAFAWAGLDHAGNPQGYLNGEVSKDYGSIINSTDLNNLKYIGTATPTFFGSLRNNFSYKNLALSFNITYKLGYYFRRRSFTYLAAYQQPDYDLRWQKPGDEKHTYVPALNYPVNYQGNSFFASSEVLVSKADHFRLKDIQFSYTFNNKTHKLPFSKLKLYVYASNLGILWRANDRGLDPDYNSSSVGVQLADPDPRSFAFGLRANF